MAILDTAKAVFELVQKLDNIELNKQIITLQSDIMGLMAENSQLKEQVSELRQKLSFHEDLVFREDAYWTNSGDGPFCSNCWDTKKVAVRMQGGATKGTFGCPACGGTMWTEEFRNRRY